MPYLALLSPKAGIDSDGLEEVSISLQEGVTDYQFGE